MRLVISKQELSKEFLGYPFDFWLSNIAKIYLISWFVSVLFTIDIGICILTMTKKL